MSAAKEDSLTEKFRLVFLPETAYLLLHAAVEIPKRIIHGKLAESGIDNFSILGSDVIYVKEAFRDTLHKKAKTGEQL